MKEKKSEEKVEQSVRFNTLTPAPKYTLQQLRMMVQAVTLADIMVYVRGFSQSALIERGARVATSHIEEDGAQIVGQVVGFLARATPDQRKLVLSVTPRFLGAVVAGMTRAAELNKTVTGRRAKRAAGRRDARATAKSILPDVRVRRTLFYSHLRAMAAGDTVWIERLNATQGAAPDGAAVGRSLDAMVKVGRELAAHVRTQGAEVTVDEALFVEMSELADRARAVDGAFTPLDGSTQTELDWYDGVNLWFLSTLVDVFTKARKVDRTIPKLSLGALASTLGSKSRRTRKTPPPAPTP